MAGLLESPAKLLLIVRCRGEFGSYIDVRPILQKGDNIKNPDNSKERLRYLREDFRASGRAGSPEVRFISEPVN